MEKIEGSQNPEDSQPVLLPLPPTTESEVNSRGEEENPAPVRLRQPQRKQLVLVAQCVDDLVGADHRVRMVAAVVERLDVSEFCKPIKAREGVAGRDATAPRLLVALWLYACIRGIGSARELVRRCEESIPFRWLCGGVGVNYRLLSDFRTDHGDSEAVREWKQRMASEEGKEIYKQRAATSETVNADLRTYRGLGQILVRGLAKSRCVALWCALAYNVMHLGAKLLP